jgi:hypothetical protein
VQHCVAWYRHVVRRALALIFVLALVTGCKNALPPLKLSVADDQANNHLVAALTLNNDATKYFNDLAAKSPSGVRFLSVSSMSTAERDVYKANVEKLASALSDAKAVPPDFLDRIHPQFSVNWRMEFIPGVSGKYDYYMAALSNPSVAPPIDTLLQARAHADQFGSWYEPNIQVIREGIRKLAR